VAVPYVDVHYGPEIKQSCPSAEQPFATREFRGTAHAVRRDVFLEVGGYREVLFRQCEESDFCLRMLDRGFVTLLVDSPPIHHFESPRRNNRQIHLYGRRNELLVVWWNYPLKRVPAGLLTSTLNGLRTGKHRRCMGVMLAGLGWGYGSIVRRMTERTPIGPQTYRLWSMLASKEAVPLNDILPILAR
jgi:GT2 family glycosyltransferase